MQRNAAVELADGHEARLRRRDSVQRLLDLAQHLPPRDRLLLMAVYRDGISLGDVAALTGVNRKQAARRVARLVRRVRAPAYRFVLQRSGALPQHVRDIGRHVHIDGMSLRDTARATRQSLHRVRQHADALRLLAAVLGAKHPTQGNPR